MISSKEEMDFVNSLNPRYPGSRTNWDTGFWLGATDYENPGKWIWVTGEPFMYTNWQEGEPTGGSQHYIQIVDSGKWNDDPSDRKCYYVCEYELYAEPDASLLKNRDAWAEGAFNFAQEIDAFELEGWTGYAESADCALWLSPMKTEDTYYFVPADQEGAYIWTPVFTHQIVSFDALLQNLGTEPICASDVISAQLVYDDTYCFDVYTFQNNKDLTGRMLDAPGSVCAPIAPLVVSEVSLAARVPLRAVNGEGGLVLYLQVGDEALYARVR